MKIPDENATASENVLLIQVTGRLDREMAARVWDQMRQSLRLHPGVHLDLDFSKVDGIDSAGVALLRSLGKEYAAAGSSIAVRNAAPDIAEFLRYMDEHAAAGGAAEIPAQPATSGIFNLWVREKLGNLHMFVAFTGACAADAGKCLLHPDRLRVGEILMQVDKVGSGALPLLCLMSFLMGMIMVFQGVATVSSFGANIYLADMVVVAVTREMAPLLTGVIMAGRSGASFAAELGSMKINGELDALEVMDFSVTGYLVLPRLAAILAAGPLLTVFADFSGILGGLVTTAVVVGLPPTGFLDEVRKVLTPADIYTGIIKGGGFALLTGVSGCFRGLAADRAPNGIGIGTTAAVVSGILSLILADAFFSALFHFFGW